jgi:hypothetical protein
MCPTYRDGPLERRLLYPGLTPVQEYAVMRFISLSPFVVSALASLFLATGCKSDKSTAATEKAADDTEVAAGSETGGQADGEAPALPAPRRMRSGEPADGTAGEAGLGPRRWQGQRGEDMRQRIEEARKQFDADGDGQLNEDERAAMRRERLKGQIERIDADSDGKISRQEAEASPFGGRMLRDFEGADANQDSFISPEELEAAMSERQSRRMERFRQRREERSAEPAPPSSE